MELLNYRIINYDKEVKKKKNSDKGEEKSSGKEKIE